MSRKRRRHNPAQVVEMIRETALLVTVEHAGNRVPRECARWFEGCSGLLVSHRGWDPGAEGLGGYLARQLGAPLLVHRVTRLLVEVNRSEHHRSLFSAVTRGLSAAERAAIVARYYRPHREAVEREIGRLLGRSRRVAHIGVHSFTPELNGEVRNAEVGLLYDPGRRGERKFCAKWRAGLLAAAPGLRVRMNYPYRGAADGLTTHLRRRFAAGRYLGIELEVNQGLLRGGRFPAQLMRGLGDSLSAAMG